MRLLYNILFPVFFLLSAPYYFWKLWRRGNWQTGFGQRFGCYGELAEQLNGKKVLWLHAVSVGEANLAIQLIDHLRHSLDGWSFVVSTTTTTGMGELTRKLPPEVHRVYYPVDWSPFVSQAFASLNPSAIVLVEAEIWPNLFWQATKANVPMHLINARLSEKSFRGYRRFGFLFHPLFASLQSACVHNEEDAQRIATLGTDSKTITVTGNMKFDGAFEVDPDAVDARALLQKLDVADDAPVLVAGSTFEGEEILMAELLPQWRKESPDLFLVLVPRHFERANSILEQLESTKLKIARRSSMDAAPDSPDMLLVDSTGELKSFFKIASVVFIGKGLTAQGGQNPIEPAAAGKAIVFGPFMQNFRAVVKELLAANGAVQVADEKDLAEKTAVLLGDPAAREALGAAALGVVQANKGATQRTADRLGQTLRALDN